MVVFWTLVDVVDFGFDLDGWDFVLGTVAALAAREDRFEVDDELVCFFFRFRDDFSGLGAAGGAGDKEEMGGASSSPGVHSRARLMM